MTGHCRNCGFFKENEEDRRLGGICSKTISFIEGRYVDNYGCPDFTAVLTKEEKKPRTLWNLAIPVRGEKWQFEISREAIELPPTNPEKWKRFVASNVVDVTFGLIDEQGAMHKVVFSNIREDQMAVY